MKDGTAREVDGKRKIWGFRRNCSGEGSEIDGAEIAGIGEWVELGDEDDRRGWWCSELAAAAARRLHAGNERTRQGEAAVSAAGTAATRGGVVAVATAEAAVGLIPCSSLSSHLRGMIILSFFK